VVVGPVGDRARARTRTRSETRKGTSVHRYKLPLGQCTLEPFPLPALPVCVWRSSGPVLLPGPGKALLSLLPDDGYSTYLQHLLIGTSLSCTALCLQHVLACPYRTSHTVHNFSSIASPSSSSFSSPIPHSSTVSRPPRPPSPYRHLTGCSVAPRRGNCAGDSRRVTLTNCSSQPLDCDRRRCVHGFYDCTQLLPAP
jgi:hypothetical protein